MARREPNRLPNEVRSPGYRTCFLEAEVRDAERAIADAAQAQRYSRERGAAPEHLLLVGGDRYVVVAYDSRIQFYRHDDLPGEGRGARAMEHVVTAAPVQQIASRPGDARVAVIAALGNQSIIEVELLEGDAAGQRNVATRTRTLQRDVGGQVQALVCTRRRLLAIVREEGAAAPTLMSVDVTNGRDLRRARLGLASLTSVAALDPDRHDLLFAVDARHGAHVVGFDPGTDSDVVQLTALDSTLRATAIAALSDQWLAVARKGGEVIQLRNQTTTGGRPPTANEICRRLRALLRGCGCPCHRHAPISCMPCDCCDDPTRPPGGGPGRPGDQPGDPGQRWSSWRGRPPGRWARWNASRR